MNCVDTVVVGAGHAGLAVSRLLSAAGREHVVLERGRVGERWRTERWDSLHLLTPSWMNRLPGWEHHPTAPDAYRSAGGFVRLLDRYVASFDTPVIESANVEAVSLAPSSQSYLVVTDRETWHTRHVVVATARTSSRTCLPLFRAATSGRSRWSRRSGTATPRSYRPVVSLSSAPHRQVSRSPTNSPGGARCRHMA
jgi:cation diffusion facilitator CzcD-associated flavoprotein CzcO